MIGQQHRAGIRIDGDASGFRAAAQQAKQDAQGLNSEVTRMSDAVRRVGHYGAGLLVLSQAFNFGRSVAATADEMSTLASRMRLVTTNATEQARVQGQLFDLAQSSRVSYAELGGTYAQIARATSDLGVSHERLLGVTQSISQAMTIGGGSADSMRAALMQLSQGLASGTLRGEELNSIMEQTPRLAQAIADGLGVSTGKLRQMGADGQLSAKQVIAALESQAGKLKTEFDQVEKTIGGAMTTAGNAIALLVRNLDQATGASAATAGMITSVAQALAGMAQSPAQLEALANAFKAVTFAGAGFIALSMGRFLADKAVAIRTNVAAAFEHIAALQAERAAEMAKAQAQVTSTASTLAMTQAAAAAVAMERELAVTQLARANAAVAAANASMQAARSAGAQSFALGVLREAEASLAAAQAARAAATNQLAYLGTNLAAVNAAAAKAEAAHAAAALGVAAAQRSAGAAASIASRALAFLGGPVGAITTALSLGATAWMLWGTRAKEGEEKAKNEIKRSTEEVIADLDKQIAKLRLRNELARLASKGGASSSEALSQEYGQAIKDFNEAVAGTGKYANLQTGAARESVIKALGGQLGRLKQKMEEAKNEESAMRLGAGGDKAGEWMAKYATKAEKMAAELKAAKDQLGIHFTPEIEKRIRDSFKEDKPSGPDPIKARAAAYKQISDELQEHADLAAAAEAKGAELSRWEAARIKTLRDIADSEKVLGPQLAAQLRARVEIRAATDRQREAVEAAAAAANREREDRLRDGQAALQRTQAMEAENRSLADEIAGIGLTRQALFELEQQRLANNIASKEQRYESMLNEQSFSLEAAALQGEIAALKERQILLSQKNTKLAGAERDAEFKRIDEEARKRREALAESIEQGILEGSRAGASIMDIFRRELKAQFAKTILRPIIMPVSNALTSAVEGLFNNKHGGLGDLIGQAWRSLTGSGNMPDFFSGASEFHGGGVVGRDRPARTLYQPASLWNGAPRFHSGLATDEFRAILKRNESVLTPEQMKQLAPVGTMSAAPRMDIRLINESGTPLQASETRQRSDGGFDVILQAAEAQMADRIGAGVGPVVGAMRSRFGLRDALV